MDLKPRHTTGPGPLADRTFRALWAAQLASIIGGWMQTVGAQWMLVHPPNAATWVSLVQAASLLPVMFLSLPAGVLAEPSTQAGQAASNAARPASVSTTS